MFDPQKAKAENERINTLLAKEPEVEEIKEFIKVIREYEADIQETKDGIKSMSEHIREREGHLALAKLEIKLLLESLEDKTGFSKAPGLAHLMIVPEKYEIKDANAVPSEYILTKMTSSVDKVKLNKAIKSGELDTNVNWLEKIESYKTVVIE